MGRHGRTCLREGVDYHWVKTSLLVLSKQDRKSLPKRRKTFLFITNDESSGDPFCILRRYKMRGEHERNLGWLSALGVKHLSRSEDE